MPKSPKIVYQLNKKSGIRKAMFNGQVAFVSKSGSGALPWVVEFNGIKSPAPSLSDAKKVVEMLMFASLNRTKKPDPDDVNSLSDKDLVDQYAALTKELNYKTKLKDMLRERILERRQMKKSTIASMSGDVYMLTFGDEGFKKVDIKAVQEDFDLSSDYYIDGQRTRTTITELPN